MESYSHNYHDSSVFIVSNYLTQAFIQDLQDPANARLQWSERLTQLNEQVNQIAEIIPRGLSPDNTKALKNLLSRFKEVEAISQYPDYLPERIISGDFYKQIVALETKLTKLWQATRDTPPTQTSPLPPTDTFGPKFDNLIIMSDVQNQLKTPKFFVPRPVGISNQQIQSFLAQVAPAALSEWKELCRLHQEMDGSAPFLEREVIKTKIAGIQTTIQAAFDDANAYDRLSPSAELAAMMTELQQSGDHLMVRSTGAEDTGAAANAGGNLSVAYVRPNDAAMMHSTGAVVASYFSVDSLKNRLEAKQNPFAEPLQLAVLSQQLIGEPVNNNDPALIPSSFVCFSSEPLYVGGEPFRAMRIEASFGHGEGVVGTQGIATDSWLILVSELDPTKYYVIPDIKRKGTRKAPVQTAPGEPTEIKTVENPPEIAKQPSLSPAQVRGIIDNMLLMEARFGDKATDFEGVCRKEGIYFVQARPVNRPAHAANYFDTTALDEEQRAAVLEMLQAKSLVPGRSNVVEITDASQIVVADTLEQAEKLYNAELGHRLVVVSRPSPRLSHPVVNFSHLGVPCLLVKDRNALDKLKSRIGANSPLEVCTQTARLHLWDRAVADPQRCLKPGFGKHPATVSPSPLVRSLRLDTSGETTENIEELLQNIRNAPTRQEGLALLKALRQHPLITKIQTASRQQRRMLHDNPNAPVKSRELSIALDQYATVVNKTFNEAEAVFSHPRALPGEKDRLQRLLHLEAIEGILLGSEDEPGAVGRCSLIHVGPLLRATTALIDYQRELAHPAQFSDLLLDVTRIPNPDPAIFHEWRNFLLTLEAGAQSGEVSPQEMGQFRMIMKSLRKSGTLPTWFTFYFQSQGGVAGLREFLTTLQPEIPFLEELTARRLQIKRLSEQMDRFAYPETFDQAWQELDAMVMTWSSEDLFRQIHSASPLAQNVAYQTMERFVTTLDTAIKTMKIGAGFTDKNEQTRRFKQMIGSYQTLMAEWAKKMLPADAIPMHADWPLPLYLARVQEIYSNLSDNDPQQLLASPGFSVSGATIGAHTAFDRHPPQRLEDLMTLAHQNLLVILSALNLRALPQRALDTSRLPRPFTQMLQAIETPLEGHHIKRIGLIVTENEIIYRGNYPLRNHSGQIEFAYHKDTQQMTMKAAFMGEARERWNEIVDWVQLLDLSKKLHMAGPTVMGAQEVSFLWSVEPDNISEAMMQFFMMGEHSLIAPGLTGLTDNQRENVIDHILQSGSVQDDDTIDKMIAYCCKKPNSLVPRNILRKAFVNGQPEWLYQRLAANVEMFLKATSILSERRDIPLEDFERGRIRLMEFLKEQNGDQREKFIDYCNKNSTDKTALLFIIEAVEGKYPEWLLTNLALKNVIRAAEYLVETSSHKGLFLLSKLLEDQNAAGLLMAGPLGNTTVPSREELNNADTRTKARCLLKFWTHRVETACAGPHSEVTLREMSPQDLKFIAEKILLEAPLRGLSLLTVFLQHQLIHPADITHIVQSTFNSLPDDAREARDKAIILVEGFPKADVSTPTQEQLASGDPWIQARAMYHLRFLIEQGNAEAIKTAFVLINKCTMNTRYRNNIRSDFEAVFCTLIHRGLAHSEAIKYCFENLQEHSVHFPRNVLDAFYSRQQQPLVFTQILMPHLSSSARPNANVFNEIARLNATSAFTTEIADAAMTMLNAGKSTGLSLFGELFKAGQGKEAALRLIEEKSKKLDDAYDDISYYIVTQLEQELSEYF